MMVKLLAALIIGLGFGYYMGYDEGYRKEPSVVTRSLDYFGLSRVRHAQTARERNVQEALKP
jgi:hypothetical protein